MFKSGIRRTGISSHPAIAPARKIKPKMHAEEPSAKKNWFVRNCIRKIKGSAKNPEKK